jgi:hypothetical protein
VGTIATSVTRYRSMSWSARSASHLSMRTTVCSKCNEKYPNDNGDMWYMGDVTRCTASPPVSMSYRVRFALISRARLEVEF